MEKRKEKLRKSNRESEQPRREGGWQPRKGGERGAAAMKGGERGGVATVSSRELPLSPLCQFSYGKPP